MMINNNPWVILNDYDADDVADDDGDDDDDDDGENVENVCWKGLNGLQEEVTSEKRGMTVTVCLPTFW